MFGELPGIFARFVRGVRRLRKRGDWDLPLDCRSVHAEWVLHANPLNTFMTECISEDPGEQIEPKRLLEAYKHWIKDNETTRGSLHGLGRTELFARIDETLGDRVSVGGHRKVWKGYSLTDPRFDDVEIIPDENSVWDDV